MAGKPIGTMYAEIDLDRSKYDKGLQDVLSSSEAGTVKVEKAWKNLGIKTDDTLNKMKANAVLSYEAIAKSGIASADEIRRAEEAKNEKLRRLNEQQFGHQTGLIESLKKNWLGYAAVVGAAVKVWDMAKTRADYDEQRGILDNLGRKYGQTADQIVDAMDRASDNQIAKVDLMKISLGGLSKGLDPTQMKNLADAALILGDAAGVSAKTALDDLTSALETGRTKGLKTYLGTTLDLKTAFGDLESKLTAAEKANAMYNITMQASADLQAQQVKAVDATADSIARAEKRYQDASLWAGRFAKGMVATAIEDLNLLKKIEEVGNSINALLPGRTEPTQKNLLGSSEELEQGRSMRRQVTEDALEQIRKQAQARVDAEKAAKEATQDAKRATEAALAAALKASEEIKGIGYSQLDEEISRINAEVAKYTTAGADKVAVAKFAAAETAKAQAKEDQRVKESQDKAWEQFRTLRAKETEESAKGAEEYRKIVADEYDYGVTEKERKVNGILAKEKEKFVQLDDLYAKGYVSYAQYEEAQMLITKNTQTAITFSRQKTTLERLKIERDMYSDLRGYEKDYYDSAKKLLEDQEAAYRKEGVSEVAIEAWKTEELYKLDQKKLKSSEDFFDGVSAAAKESAHDMTKWGTAGYDVVKAFSKNAASQMSGNFFNLMKGRFGDIKLDWESLWDSMLQSFSDSLAKMVTDAAIKKVSMFFEASWTDTSASILGLINKGWDLLNGTSPGSFDSNTSGDWMSTFNASHYKGGLIEGGPVGGAAKYAGDHPGNDTVPAWLSPGEVVIRRGAVNADTAELLDYINRTGRTPYYAGGQVMNTVTRQPGRGYFGFGDVVSSLTGGFTDFIGLTNSSLPTLGAYLKSGDFSSVEELIARIADPSGIVRGGTRDLGSKMPAWMIDVAQVAGPIIGAIWGPGGAAAGSDIASELAAGHYGGSVNERDHFVRAGMAAVLTYLAQGKGGPESGTLGENVSNASMTAAKKYASNWAIGQIAQTMFGTAGRRGGISFMGAGGDMSWLVNDMGGIAPKSFAFSARNGLDYVPYDNFPILAHEGERVQTKKEADATRSGGKIEFHFHGTIIDRKAVAEFAEMILPDINKLQRWGHA